MRRSRTPTIAGAAALIATAALAAVAWPILRRPDPSAVLAKARDDFQAGRLDAARAALDRLASVPPVHPMVHMARAQIAEAQGQADDAVAAAAAILDDPALGPLAHLLTGRVEIARHRLRPAEAHFKKAAEGLPNESQPFEELAYIYNLQHRWSDFDRAMLAVSDRGGLDFDRVLQWGKSRHVNWDPREDCETLAACVAADPDDRASRLTLAQGLYRQNEIQEAEDVLAPLPADDLDAAALRAAFAVERGDDEKAARIVQSAPADAPALAEVRARLALKRGDLEAAVAAFRLALKAKPDDRALLQGLGTALRLSGDAEGAAECFRVVDRFDAVSPLIARAATSRGKNDPSLPPLLSAACAAAGRLPEALAWARLSLAENPLDREAQQTVYRLDRELGPR